MKNFFLTLIGAALLSAGWLGLTGIPLLAAFVPFLIISDRHATGKVNFWKTAGWIALGFGIWSGITTWWIWYAAPIGAILSVLITIGLFGGVFMLFHWISKRAPRPLAYTLLVSGWLACEYLYTNGEVSFPWLTLGNGFANDIKLVQWYDVTGVFGGSLWVWCVNIAIFFALKTRKAFTVVAAAFLALAPVVVSLIKYATYKEDGQAVNVTIVQPNIDPYTEKYFIPQQEQTRLMLDLASTAPTNTDFIVFPETAIHEDIWENSISSNPIISQFRTLLSNKYPGAQIIMGASTRKYYLPGEKVSSTARYNRNAEIWYDAYNSTFPIDTTANIDIYHKSMLVVGVEKMPYYSIMKHLEFLIIDLGGTTGQLGTDPERKVFTNPSGIETGTAICWEGVYGQYYGGYILKGAELMFIISNDGWWEDTAGYKQLFQLSRLRAVETRRSIARSANTGKSGFINQRGDVLQWAGWDIRTSLHDTLRINDKITFYTRYGDYIARVGCYIFGLCILYFIAYRIKRRNNLAN